MAEKQLLQTRLKSINSPPDNNAKQLELTRSKVASILTAPNYQQCQEFIEKIKEKRFNKVKERQVRKLNNLINKKEGGITWQSIQVFPAARASPWVNNRQAANNSQAGRLISRAPPQASQEDSALPQSNILQVGNPQGLLADSSLSPAESAVSQADSSQLSPGESALSPAESELSQAGSSPPCIEDRALPQSDFSQAGSSQASLGDSTLSLAESELSQAGSSQPSLEDSALSQSDISQAGSSKSSLEDSTLQAESAVLPQAVRHLARLRASHSSRQAGTTPREDSSISLSVRQHGSPGGISPGQCFPGSKGFPQNRHITPLGSSPLEEPNPKWVINLSSKPLTPVQRSVLAKGPNFAVTPKHPPNLEYITAIEAACTKLSQQDAEELRANINWVLRDSHLPNPNLTKAQNLAIRNLKGIGTA